MFSHEINLNPIDFGQGYQVPQSQESFPCEASYWHYHQLTDNYSVLGSTTNYVHQILLGTTSIMWF